MKRIPIKHPPLDPRCVEPNISHLVESIAHMHGCSIQIRDGKIVFVRSKES